MKKFLGWLLVILLMVPNPSLAFEEKGKLSFEFFTEPLIGVEKSEFEVVLKNSGRVPITFEFPSSQKYELKVISPEGKEVYVYSKDRTFAQGIEKITLNPGEEKRWKEHWDYQFEGKRVSKGNYRMVAVLQSSKRNNLSSIPVNYEETVFIPSEDAVFQNIKVKGKNGKYQVAGDARPKIGEFYYTVEDGHNELIAETKVQVGSKFPQWSSFQLSIIIPEEKLPRDGTLVMNMYERDAQGNVIQSHPVLLEKFYEE